MLSQILSRLESVKKSSSGWSAKCPVHDGHGNVSLSISEGDDGRILIKCFAGCEVESIVTALGLEMKDLFPKRVKGHGSISQKQLHTCTGEKQLTEKIENKPVHNGVHSENANCTGAHLTLTEYANSKQLPVSFLTSLGLFDQTHQAQRRICIPYYDESGEEVARRYRTRNASGKKVTFWRKGDKTLLYGLWRLDRDNLPEHIIVCEGESDAQSLWHHDFPALGLPGASNWNDQRDAPHLEGISTIYIIREPDQGGKAVEKWLSKSSIQDRAYLVELSDHKDPSDLYIADPEGFRASMQAALDAAISWNEIQAQRKDELRKDSWEKCSALANEKSILDLFVQCLPSCGFAGEEKTARLLFLCLMTRLFQRPTSTVVDGPSSAGKSFLVETVLKFFPVSAYHDLSAMSERNLAYTEEPLSHRFLVLYEAAGLGSDFATYLIRSLLSEGRIKYEFVEKTSEGLRSRLVEKMGPTGLIMTTTSVWLHAENETRVLTVTISDTKKQTENVFLMLANETNEEVDFMPWHALQEWIVSGDHNVVIPFATALAKLTKPLAVRLRRDFSAILSLIRAHALLHQKTRERDNTGAIVATLDDYAAVLELAGDIIAHSVEVSVRASVRETVQAAKEVLESSNGEPKFATIKGVAEKLGLDRSATSRRINTAIRYGYLKNLEQSKSGKSKKIVPGDPLPEDVDIFPTIEDLANLCRSEKAAQVTAQVKNKEKQEDSKEVCTCASVQGDDSLPPTPDTCGDCDFFSIEAGWIGCRKVGRRVRDLNVCPLSQ